MFNAACVEKLDDIAHDHGFVLVVGDEDRCQSQFQMNFTDAALQFLAQFGVNGGQWLIQQQHLWFGDDGACQCHALLLTAGKIGRVGFFFALEIHQIDGIFDLLLNFVSRFLLHFQSECDVLLDVHVWEQGILLKHHADVALICRQMGDVLTVEDDAAGCYGFQTGQAAQQHGLAAAGRPQQRHQFPFIDVEIDFI